MAKKIQIKIQVFILHEKRTVIQFAIAKNCDAKVWALDYSRVLINNSFHQRQLLEILGTRLSL